MSTYRIAVIPGDGIGPEIVAEALKVLDKVGAKFGHTFEYTHRLMGGAAYDAVGTCFPEDTVAVCKEHDAVLLGAVLDQKIASLDLSIQGNSGKGNMVTLKAELKDPEGEPVRGVVPLELTVLDPKGRKTDDSFFTSAVDGKFRHTLRIPLNTPPGKWTAVIRSLADNRSVKKHF